MPSSERRTSDDRRADRQTSAANSRWSRPLPRRLIGDSAGTTARAAGESSWFPIGSPSVSLDRQWRDRHRLGRFIEDEFQPADVAAVDSISFWHIAIVADLRLARGTLPWWRRRTAREEIAVTRPLNHACGWSNLLAGSRPRNHVHFAAAVSFFRALRCPMARQPTAWPGDAQTLDTRPSIVADRHRVGDGPGLIAHVVDDDTVGPGAGRTGQLRLRLPPAS